MCQSNGYISVEIFKKEQSNYSSLSIRQQCNGKETITTTRDCKKLAIRYIQGKFTTWIYFLLFHCANNNRYSNPTASSFRNYVTYQIIRHWFEKRKGNHNYNKNERQPQLQAETAINKPFVTSKVSLQLESFIPIISLC